MHVGINDLLSSNTSVKDIYVEILLVFGLSCSSNSIKILFLA